ncbi:MAG: TonB-dependent receptor [Candidatus Solibacter usitatus]|nr:TonB-dependent receptor [Candidatus Solibacter usitatus]
MSRFLMLVLTLLAAFAESASAQILYGSIVGNVKDGSGAAVVDATVTVKDAATGFSRQARTNETGQFQVPTVPSGVYEITITKTGFSTFSSKAVNVSSNAVSRVDASLEVGAVTESIRVDATSLVLQTDRAEVRSEIIAKQFENAPLPPGRNYSQMFKVLPGFTYPRNGNGPSVDPSRAALYNVNGTSRSSNSVRLEGSGVNQIWLPHLPGYTPALEAIETVNITTNSFDAETGLAGGAAVNVSIKTGTNALHGTAFEYHNSNATKAKPFFLPAGERKPKAIFNQMGGTIGGPILKNKLFFFGSYEGTYDRQFASRLETIPTLAIRRGDMSESPTAIYDPATGAVNGTGRTPFADKRIPTARMDPIALKLQSMLPNPTFNSLTANLFGQGKYQFNSQKMDAKINWNAGNRLTVFARGGLQDHNFESGPLLGELLGVPFYSPASVAGPTYGTTGNMSAGATYVLTPTLILDGNFGYNAYDANSQELGLGKNIGSEVLGIPGVNGKRNFESGWPRFSVSNYTTMGAQGNGSRPFYNRDPRYQYVANATWTKGAHQIRFGFDSSFQQLNHTQVEFVGALHGASGGFTFAGGPTMLSGGPASNQFNTWSAFLLGLPTAKGRILQVPDEYNVRTAMHSLFVRDQWQVNRKLTLSVGTRWENFPMPTRVGRGMENYNPATNRMEICGVGAIPEDCGVQQSKKLFAPRIGLAWRPTEDFVFRAGYGITVDPYSLARPMRTNYPLLVVLNINAPNTFQTAGPLRDGIPQIPTPDLGNGVINIDGQVAANSLERNFQRGYVQSWNFTVQKKLAWGFTGQAGYVATRQINQVGFRELNYAPINGGNTGRVLTAKFGRTAETRLVAPIGNSHYDSLQTSLDRRFSRGVHVGISYTWSKSLGVCCSENSDGLAAIQIPEYSQLNRSLTNSDVPHNLTMNSIWELPFGKGKRWAAGGGVTSWLSGGWQLTGILSLVSGTPFSVSSAGTSLNANGSAQRADQVKADVAILGGAGRGQSYFDPFAFRAVTDPRFGTAGFNSLRGPGIVNLDMGLFREFGITEKWRVQFRAETFNTSNTPHFANPGANASNLQLNADGSIRNLGGFTEITSIANNGRDGIDERVFRFGLRVSF